MEEGKSSKGKERKSVCKTKRLRKQRPGRVERLKEAVRKKEVEVSQLNEQTMSLKKTAAKGVFSNKQLKKYVVVYTISIISHNSLTL